MFVKHCYTVGMHSVGNQIYPIRLPDNELNCAIEIFVVLFKQIHDQVLFKDSSYYLYKVKVMHYSMY